MKRYTVTVLFIGILFASISPICAYASLEAHWKFDGNVDDSRYGYYDGTTVGDPTFQNGIINQCIYLDGNDCIDTGETEEIFVGNQISVSLWILPHSNSDQCFIGQHRGDGANLFLFGCWDNKIQIQIYDKKYAKEPMPVLGIWHHLAAVVSHHPAGGSHDSFSIARYYLNGQLQWISEPLYDTFESFGEPWTIGQDWDERLLGGGRKRSDFFTGYMDDVRLYAGTISDNSIRNLYAQPFLGTNPIPAHNALDVDVLPKLSWTPGYNVIEHILYLDTVNPPKAEFHFSGPYRSFEPGLLQSGQTYYWQVKSRTMMYGEHMGPVWKFTVTDDYLASEPKPADAAEVFVPEPVLQWTAGKDALSHDVYFDTANPPLAKIADDHPTTSLNVGLLTPGQTYYWQVRENTPLGTFDGPVWEFTASQFHLDVQSFPQTAGTVQLDPPGGDYWEGTEVTLTANEEVGYIFNRWGGDTDGIANPHIITMDSHKSLTAYFAVFITVDDDGGADFESIQDAIDSAADGHVILVHPGTYNENINLLGKAITLTGTDPDNPGVVATTIINGGDNGSVITCNNSEDPNTLITGFTVTGGDNQTGGGLNCANARPTIAWCAFTANTAAEDGGGICLDTSNAVITHCTFIDNNAQSGGAVSCDNSDPVITHCIFSTNTADYSAAIDCDYDGAPKITHCAFSGNTATQSGGAIGSGPNAIVTNCAFDLNVPDNFYGIDSRGPQLQYCCLAGDYPGKGNINASPMFVNPVQDNLRLQSDSPCIDAGNTMAIPMDSADLDHDGITYVTIPLDLDGNNRLQNVLAVADSGVFFTINMPIVDIGPYEHPGTEHIDGDFDGDGDVDLADFATFAANWMKGSD